MKTPEEIKKDQQEFLNAAKPLIEYLCKNKSPYHKAIVDCTSVELVQSEMGATTEEFLQD